MLHFVRRHNGAQSSPTGETLRPGDDAGHRRPEGRGNRTSTLAR
ncbi:hypothetical protein FM119_10730 [Mycetocola reblochoni REB411]|uniref:Uncharacterized protein n=1 Tax=Mycetocola reblochoni REB411 TaxID=1255698 RepID=A0A1R4K1C5_9MICO|nr:hypothetical protein FM119_10730 [Mycetocola reblochoni REB411]